jgi:hypothetical protein
MPVSKSQGPELGQRSTKGWTMHTGLCGTSPGTKGPDCRPARRRDAAAATRHYHLTRPDLRYRRRAALPALQQVPVSSRDLARGIATRAPPVATRCGSPAATRTQRPPRTRCPYATDPQQISRFRPCRPDPETTERDDLQTLTRASNASASRAESAFGLLTVWTLIAERDDCRCRPCREIRFLPIAR